MHTSYNQSGKAQIFGFSAGKAAARGSRVYFCLRWESSTNLKGPYSEIYSATIP